jgi:uroporphyrinogen III methyltransferase/synthase
VSGGGQPAAPPHVGRVSIVGAGPGDPSLATVRALELLRECDAVVYDALVDGALLDRALEGRTRAAELHFVGKRGGEASVKQEEINALLLRLARDGKHVVRLKGGDPFVFGRGGEEAQLLAAERIPFEIVPGVTAGIAAAAYAGIPVTHRGAATSVTFVTGHEDPTRDVSGTDWSALARTGGTLVLYMGVKRLAEVAGRLVGGGLAPVTPAAIVEWGTYPRQRVVQGTLSTIAARAEAEGIAAPAITVIGEVVRLRADLAWFDRRPLFGRRIVVTRARAQASELSARLRGLGADVIEVPAIRIVPLDLAPLRHSLGRLGQYQWVILTSQNAVRIVWDELRALGLDARALAGARIGVVGEATATALREHGIEADLRPERSLSEGLVEALRHRDVRGAKVLFPRAAAARGLLPDELRAMGAQVDEVEIYHTEPDTSGAAELAGELERGAIDLLTFSSGSTVRFFVDAVGADRARHVPAVSIGPITSEAARAAGIQVVGEAAEPSIDGLVDAVLLALGTSLRDTRPVSRATSPANHRDTEGTEDSQRGPC